MYQHYAVPLFQPLDSLYLSHHAHWDQIWPFHTESRNKRLITQNSRRQTLSRAWLTFSLFKETWMWRR